MGLSMDGMPRRGSWELALPAEVVTDGAYLGIVWDRRPADLPGTDACVVLASDGTDAYLAQVHVPASAAVAAADVAASARVVRNPLRVVAALPRDRHAPLSGEVAILSALVEVAKAREPLAVVAILSMGFRDAAVAEWVAPGGRCADHLLFSMATVHPWAMPLAARRKGVFLPAGDARDTDGTVAAGIAAALSVTPDKATALVRRLRHFSPTSSLHMAGAMCGLDRILDAPPDMQPPPIAPGVPSDHPSQDETMALALAGPEVSAFAEASGRTFRSVAGRVPSWTAYDAMLCRRTDFHARPLSGAYVGAVLDMVDAFHAQVVSPAMARLGLPPDPSRGRHHVDRAASGIGHPGRRAALRLLLGERTYPALVDLSARWHARHDRVQAAVMEALSPDLPDGPRPFDAVPVGDGVSLVCLYRAVDLIDEGATGPDRNGVRGLSHCVGSYVPDVLNGDCAILSLRRDLPDGGFERLTTAEVRNDGGCVWVAQHRGRENAAPTEDQEAMLAAGLAMVPAESWAPLSEAGTDLPMRWDLAAMLSMPGAWEAARDAWAFALPRPLRGIDAAGLMAAGGLVPGLPPHG